jgi:hypothetical protein
VQHLQEVELEFGAMTRAAAEDVDQSAARMSQARAAGHVLAGITFVSSLPTIDTVREFDGGSLRSNIESRCLQSTDCVDTMRVTLDIGYTSSSKTV